MSDGQWKNHEEATKAFHSSDSGRERCKSEESSDEIDKKTTNMNKKPMIDRIDESEFKKTKIWYGSERRYLTKQGSNEGFNAASNVKNGDDVVSKKPSVNLEISPEDISHQKVLALKANNDEGTYPEETGIEEIDEVEFKNTRRQSFTGIEEIDEAEFKNKRRQLFAGIEEIDEADFRCCIAKRGPSTWKYKNGCNLATNSAQNVKIWNRKNVHDGDSSSLSKFTDPSSNEAESDNVNISLQYEEGSSCGAEHETGPSIASPTRSKMGEIKKPPEVDNVSLISSLDLDSFPADSAYRSFRDEEESSDGGILFMGFNLDAHEPKNDTLMKLSAETEYCRKDDDSVEQSEESNCKQPENKENGEEVEHKGEGGGVDLDLDGTNLRLSSRKRPLRYEASRKPAKDGKVQKTSKASNHQEKTEAIDTELQVHHENETQYMADETNVPVTIERKDLCSILADAVLGRVQFPQNKESKEAEQVPASQIQNTLPLKFRFEDDVPEIIEKTEYEKEIEEQFAIFDYHWTLEKLQSIEQVDMEKVNSPAEETQYERCCRGKHELVIEDEEGLICIYCRHVELGPKDVLPEWVEIPYRQSERKRLPEMERLLEFDDLHLQSSVDDVAAFQSTTGTVWSIKPGIQESMYKHQREGFEFIWKNLAGSINLDELKSNDPGEVGGCIISHAPGTGKTRLTIVFLETYLKMFPNCFPVIIGPASMLLTWEEEFRKWNVEFPFHNLCNVELSAQEKDVVGPLAQPLRREKEYIRMIKIYSWSKGGRILGISYNLFQMLTGRKMKENIRKILLEKPGLVVLDEGHTPRNQRSSIWKSLLELKTSKRIILSGTPFQNNFVELFNTLRIVRPAVADVLSQERAFDDMMTRKISRHGKHKGQHVQSSLSKEAVDAAVEKLKMCMLPFVHVHKGTILQQSLPGLRDCVVVLNPPEMQKSLIERLEGTNTFKFEHDVALVSIHPYLIKHCDVTKDQLIGIDMGAVEASEVIYQEGVKTRFVVELIRLSMAVKERVLIFSQFIQPLQLIKEQLKQLFQWVEGRQILQMHGNVDLKHRQVLIYQFNDPQSESKIMLASIKCCSEGISLIGASRVVLLDVVWNPSVERQAISRAYRIGQKKFVYTYHLMTSGTTEADKYCRQAEKERLSELVFASSNECRQQKHPSVGIEDRILEVMVGNKSLNEIFEKIINQPKDTDLIQTFGLMS